MRPHLYSLGYLPAQTTFLRASCMIRSWPCSTSQSWPYLIIPKSYFDIHALSTPFSVRFFALIRLLRPLFKYFFSTDILLILSFLNQKLLRRYVTLGTQKSSRISRLPGNSPASVTLPWPELSRLPEKSWWSSCNVSLNLWKNRWKVSPPPPPG